LASRDSLFQTIDDIALVTINSAQTNNHPTTTILVYPREGQPLQLGRFAAGPITLYDSLRRAWLAAGPAGEKRAPIR